LIEEKDMSEAHDAEFERLLAEEQFRRGASRSGRRIPPEAVRAITAAVGRGAFTPERVEVYAGLVANAVSDAERAGVIATINSLVGRDGRNGIADAQAEAEAEDLELLLYPPKTPEQARRRDQLIAASQARSQGEEEDFSHLFPPGSYEEAGKRLVTASRRPPRRVEDEWPDEELHAACFGDSEYGPGAHNAPRKGRRR